MEVNDRIIRQQEFDEDHGCLILLPCSQCQCGSCNEKRIPRNPRVLLFNGENIRATSLQELPKNFFSEDLLNYIQTCETKNTSPEKSPAKCRAEMIQEVKRSSFETNKGNKQFFQMAGDRVKRALQTTEDLKETYSESYKKVKLELMSEIKNLDESYQLNARFLQDESERLKKQENEVKKQQEECNEVEDVLEAATSFNMLDSAIDKAEESHASVQSYIKEFSSFITKEENFLEGLKKNVKHSKHTIMSVTRILASSIAEEESVTQYMRTQKLQEGNNQQVTIQLLQEMNPDTKDLVMLGGIYAVQNEMENKRYASLSLYGDKLLLHYLRDRELPPNARTIEYAEVMKMVDTSSRRMFLELSNTNNEKFGKLFIRLSPDTKRATQFAILCLAEKGPTYAASKCHTIFNNGTTLEYLGFGDYENRDGFGGKAIITDVSKEEGGSHKRSALAGTVQGRDPQYGEEQATHFFIYTKDNPSDDLDYCFGMVEEGLHVLKEAFSSCTGIQDLVISDCGIVLSR